MSIDTPALGTITRHNGVAGQYSYTVPVTYGDEDDTVMTFIGSTYGGRVVVAWLTYPEGMFVSRDVMDRCGDMLTPAWIERYFSDHS